MSEEKYCCNIVTFLIQWKLKVGTKQVQQQQMRNENLLCHRLIRMKVWRCSNFKNLSFRSKLRPTHSLVWWITVARQRPDGCDELHTAHFSAWVCSTVRGSVKVVGHTEGRGLPGHGRWFIMHRQLVTASHCRAHCPRCFIAEVEIVGWMKRFTLM